MTKAVHLIGRQDAVYLALADRLKRAGATFTENKEDSDLIMAIGGNAPFSSEIDVAVIPSNFSTPNTFLCIFLFQMLKPRPFSCLLRSSARTS